MIIEDAVVRSGSAPMKSTWYSTLLGLLVLQSVVGFSPPQHHGRSVRTRGMSDDGLAAKTTASTTTRTALGAKPQRLAENVDGVVYVNDRVSFIDDEGFVSVERRR